MLPTYNGTGYTLPFQEEGKGYTEKILGKVRPKASRANSKSYNSMSRVKGLRRLCPSIVADNTLLSGAVCRINGLASKIEEKQLKRVSFPYILLSGLPQEGAAHALSGPSSPNQGNPSQKDLAACILVDYRSGEVDKQDLPF